MIIHRFIQRDSMTIKYSLWLVRSQRACSKGFDKRQLEPDLFSAAEWSFYLSIKRCTLLFNFDCRPESLVEQCNLCSKTHDCLCCWIDFYWNKAIVASAARFISKALVFVAVCACMCCVLLGDVPPWHISKPATMVTEQVEFEAFIVPESRDKTC